MGILSTKLGEERCKECVGGKILSLVLYCIHTGILEGVNVTTHLVVGKHIRYKSRGGEDIYEEPFYCIPNPSQTTL